MVLERGTCDAASVQTCSSDLKLSFSPKTSPSASVWSQLERFLSKDKRTVFLSRLACTSVHPTHCADHHASLNVPNGRNVSEYLLTQLALVFSFLRPSVLYRLSARRHVVLQYFGFIIPWPHEEGIWMRVSEWFSPVAEEHETYRKSLRRWHRRKMRLPRGNLPRNPTPMTPQHGPLLRDTLTQTRSNKYSTSVRHPRASRVLIYLKYRVNVAYPISRVRWSISVT